MSEEAKAETVEAVEGDPEAIFRELGEQERASAPDADKEEPGDKGQADDDTPSGQVDTGTPTKDADKAPPASETADIWKDVPEPARKAFEQSEAARIKAENVAKAHGGRLTQAYQERDALNARLAEAGKAAGPKARQEGHESDEDYRKRMTEEYPEFARLFTELDGAKAEIDTLKGTVTTDRTTAAARQTEDALLEQGKVFEAAHPDWETEKKDPAVQAKFLEWAQSKPAYVQDALRRNAQEITDGGSAADLISMFKRETADPAKEAKDQRRADQLDAGRDTKSRSPSTTKTGAAEGDADGIWRELQAADARKAAADNRNQGRR